MWIFRVCGIHPIGIFGVCEGVRRHVTYEIGIFGFPYTEPQR